MLISVQFALKKNLNFLFFLSFLQMPLKAVNQNRAANNGAIVRTWWYCKSVLLSSASHTESTSAENFLSTALLIDPFERMFSAENLIALDDQAYDCISRIIPLMLSLTKFYCDRRSTIEAILISREAILRIFTALEFLELTNTSNLKTPESSELINCLICASKMENIIIKKKADLSFLRKTTGSILPIYSELIDLLVQILFHLTNLLDLAYIGFLTPPETRNKLTFFINCILKLEKIGSTIDLNSNAREKAEFVSQKRTLQAQIDQIIKSDFVDIKNQTDRILLQNQHIFGPFEFGTTCLCCFDYQEDFNPFLRLPACGHILHIQCAAQLIKASETRACPCCKNKISTTLSNLILLQHVQLRFQKQNFLARPHSQPRPTTGRTEYARSQRQTIFEGRTPLIVRRLKSLVKKLFSSFLST